MTSPNHVHVIVNPASGQHPTALEVLNDAFRAASVSWNVSVTRYEGEARGLARGAAADGADVVAAYGGDGTVADVASGLIGTGARLAILPGGTANVLAQTLGIGDDLAVAAALASGTHGVERAVDALEIDGESHVLLQAGVGVHAAMVEDVDRARKKRWGYGAYVVSLLRWLRDPPYARFRLHLDDRYVDCGGVACMICNAGTVARGTVSLSPTISMCDGLLDVMVLRRLDVPTAAGLLWAMSRDREPASTAVQHWKARAVEVTTDQPYPVQGDGSTLTETPVRARALPGAVRVLVPRHAPLVAAPDAPSR